MIYKTDWKSLATESYFNEMNFILLKWNQNEVQKFEDLVYDFLETISKTPTIGKYKSDINCYSLVISKQTTLYYKIIEDKNQIDLLYFWNNTKNPDDLAKLL